MIDSEFLKFTKHVSNLENGVLMSFGSATMAPEIFLKALPINDFEEKLPFVLRFLSTAL